MKVPLNPYQKKNISTPRMFIFTRRSQCDSFLRDMLTSLAIKRKSGPVVMNCSRWLSETALSLLMNPFVGSTQSKRTNSSMYRDVIFTQHTSWAMGNAAIPASKGIFNQQTHINAYTQHISHSNMFNNFLS